MLTDSHCHLNYPEFADLDAVLARARCNGVTTFLTVNTQLSQTRDLITLAMPYPDVFCSAGVHPHEADKADLGTLTADLIAYAAEPKIIAFGETGLDYYYNHSNPSLQRQSFAEHLSAASVTGLPVIIHTRQADEDTVALLDDYPQTKGVFHCFSGDIALARKALDRGYVLSFSGIITFNKAEELREVVRYVPLTQMLTETDAPYLAPHPHRGKPNEPAYVRLVAQKIAECKGIGLEEVAAVTTANFFRVFAKAADTRQGLS